MSEPLPRREREAPEIADAIIRMVRNSLGRRTAIGDLTALEEIKRVRLAVREIETAAGLAAHEAGYSYAQIAYALGISRQRAHERFSGETPIPDDVRWD